MDLDAGMVCCEVGLRFWLVQKCCKAEQAAGGQEGNASEGGDHGCAEEHSHITPPAGSCGVCKALLQAWLVPKKKGTHSGAFPALLMMP
jgi:hypothetical protein